MSFARRLMAVNHLDNALSSCGKSLQARRKVRRPSFAAFSIHCIILLYKMDTTGCNDGSRWEDKGR